MIDRLRELATLSVGVAGGALIVQGGILPITVAAIGFIIVALSVLALIFYHAGRAAERKAMATR